jgi:hypothetical protein
MCIRKLLFFANYLRDIAQIDFIMSALSELVGPFEEPKVQPKTTQVTRESATTKTKAVDSKRLNLISQVKDMLPDLGDGFIDACLDAMNDNVERVLNCILENNLPGELGKLDRNMPLQATAPTKALPIGITSEMDSTDNLESPAKPSLLAARRNVFENDEFDILSRDTIDRSKVHIRGYGNRYPILFIKLF